jgi:hypothetical protein
MPNPRHRAAACLVSLAAALAMAAPAAAQTPGDDQYQDPFGGDSGQATPTPQATPAPAAPAPAAPAPAPAAPSADSAQARPAPAPPAAPQLPYTGSPVDAALLAVAGGVLLAGGLTLRVRLRDSTGA